MDETRAMKAKAAALVSIMFREAGTEEQLEAAEKAFQQTCDDYKCLSANERLYANGRIMVRGKKCAVSGKMVSLDWCDRGCQHRGGMGLK